MCGICNVVNCIRRNLFGCGSRRSNGCGYSRNNGCGCDRNAYCDNNNSYREEPCMNVVCANRQNRNFTPCCDDANCRCNRSRDCDCD